MNAFTTRLLQERIIYVEQALSEFRKEAQPFSKVDIVSSFLKK